MARRTEAPGLCAVLLNPVKSVTISCCFVTEGAGLPKAG
jgi:hypothetical protein